MSRQSRKQLRRSAVALGLAGSAMLLTGCLTANPDLPPPVVAELQQVPPAPAEADKAIAHLAAGRTGLAIVELNTALAREPGSERILNLLGVAYDRLGRHDVALGFFTRALAQAPESAETLHNIGFSYYLQSDYPSANRYFERALVISEGPLQVAIRGRLLALQVRLPGRDRPVAVSGADPRPPTSAQVIRTGERTYDLRTMPAAVTVNVRIPEQTAPPATEALAETPPAPSSVIQSQPAFERLHLEVANGAGRRKLAARVAHYLSEQGLTPRYVTNADHFEYARTTILYREGHEDAARQLAASLPVAADLVRSDGTWPNLKIILGSDLLPFDQTLTASLKETGHADLLI